MRNYSIYCLFDSRYPSEIRYIGLTGRNIKERLKEHVYESTAINKGIIKGKKTHKYHWINKNKDFISIELIEDNIAKEEVEDKEIFYIETFKEKGCKLVNTNYGPSHFKDGYRLNVQARENIRIARNRPEVEQKRRASWKCNMTQDIKDRISATLKAKGSIRKHTEEDKKKMSEICTHKKKVVQYDIEGNFIKEFESIKDTSKYGYKASCVSRTCTHGGKHMGFIWKFKQINKNIKWEM